MRRKSMRRALLATLALSPVLLHAQANSPAQLESKLAAPAAIGATADRGTTSKPLRISTGVSAPKLIHSVSVSSDNTWPWTVVGVTKTVVVNMGVDTNGIPTQMKIVKSA